MPRNLATSRRIAAPMWANMATAALESAAPRPCSQPSITAADVGGRDQAVSSPKGAVSTQASST